MHPPSTGPPLGLAAAKCYPRASSTGANRSPSAQARTRADDGPELSCLVGQLVDVPEDHATKPLAQAFIDLTALG